MNKFKVLLYNIIGLTYIPESIVSIQESKLLHISDTPVIFFHQLKRIIKKLSPQIIIHTGDLVDDIKIGIYKNFLPKYEYHVKSIINILESSSASTVYISIGNHDNKDVIKKYAKRSVIIDDILKTQIFGASASISHYPMKIAKDPSRYNFFGHDITIRNDIVKNRVYLNGISSLNIITKDTRRVFHIPYPNNIDDSRLLKRKIGL